MKKSLLGIIACLFVGTISAQEGLEGIVVEKYYISNEEDSLDAAENFAPYALSVGSVTYRVYANLQTGYKVIQLFGSSAHPLEFATSTSFYNDPNFGFPVYQGISLNNTRKNTTLIDSYITIGAVANGLLGVLKAEDTDGTIGNQQGILENSDPDAGLPIMGPTGVDGLMPGSPILPNVLGIGAELDVLDQTAGGSFISTGGAIATLGGMEGVTSSNHVLLGQFTTDGVFSFKINLQLGTPQVGGSEIYVAENPQPGEFTDSTLVYTSPVDTGGVGVEYIPVRSEDLFTLFPNPSNDVINIIARGSLGKSGVVIRDFTGRVVMESAVWSSVNSISIEQLPSGVYTLTLSSGDRSSTRKFIRQ
jgi:hypothetical protein